VHVAVWLQGENLETDIMELALELVSDAHLSEGSSSAESDSDTV